MKPTLQEMKLAVAKMLPQHLDIKPCPCEDFPWLIRWIDGMDELHDREWLHVCWLAEQLLTDDEAGRYDTILDRIVTMLQPPKKEPYIWNASADDKLLALCRVKFPEMFIKE